MPFKGLDSGNLRTGLDLVCESRIQNPEVQVALWIRVASGNQNTASVSPNSQLNVKSSGTGVEFPQNLLKSS
ncbi:hypothetical protein I79_023774 [Cricetulus griseus]|uniref:Uncharacterized protein n=1 Tax=Cricetulus griseus TaxID=10029 RepID=G3IIU6_CRIGR|nr:hypothetical protein I79_023774 [Cricetulus griseus]